MPWITMTRARNCIPKDREKGSLRSCAFLRISALLLACFLVPSVFAFPQEAPPSRIPEPVQPSPSDQPDESNSANLPSLVTPLKPQEQEATYHPITPRQRLRWFITNTIGPPHLVGGLFAAGFGTALDRPEESGLHLGGFADRYGMRMTGIVTGNAIEASVGSI